MWILDEFYPSLKIFILERFNQTKKLESYYQKCQEYQVEREFRDYSIYVHGYLIPWFGRLLEDGQLKTGGQEFITQIFCSPYEDLNFW